jgi:hypothetical protein
MENPHIGGKKRMKVKTSVSLDTHVMEKLKSEAARDRRSVSQLIEMWLEDALAVRESLKETTTAAPAPAQG